MSLMNDALRKKSRETKNTNGASGNMDGLRKKRMTKKRFPLMATTVLSVATVLAGAFLVQSITGGTSRELLAQPTQSYLLANQDLSANQDIDVSSSFSSRTDTAIPKSPQTGDAIPKKPEVSPLKRDVPTNAPMMASKVDDSGTIAQPIITDTIKKTPEKNKPTNELRPDARATVSSEKSANRKIDRQSKKHSRSAGNRSQSFGQDDNPFYQKALTYHRNGQLSEAIYIYKKVLRSETDHEGAMLNLAAALLQQGNFHEAESLLEKLEKSHPRTRGVLLNLAIAAIGNGRSKRALAYLDRAQEAADASPEDIAFHRAVAYSRLNRFQDALAVYQKILERRPEDATTRFNLAVTCDSMGLYPKALIHYKTLLTNEVVPSGINRESIHQRVRTISRYLDADGNPIKEQ